jgi:hypothetical protein
MLMGLPDCSNPPVKVPGPWAFPAGRGPGTYRAMWAGGRTKGPTPMQMNIGLVKHARPVHKAVVLELTTD